jgi:MtN3 and saliva related transmembrane protein
MSDLVGFVAAALTTIAFVPQAARTLRTRNTAGISLEMYMLEPPAGSLVAL